MAEASVRAREPERTVGHGAISRLFFAVCAAGMLSACQEPDVILPGEREPIDAVLSTFDANDPALSPNPDNEARAIALPSQVANASAPQFFGTPEFRTAHPSLGSALTRVWSTNIGAGDGRKQRITADPVIGGGRIFTLDAGTRVTAVSTAGEPLWTADIKPGLDNDDDATGGGLALDGETLYVSSGFGVVTALEAATGAERWQQKLQSAGAGRPLVVDDLVYLTAGDQIGWAIEKANGRIAWQTTAADSIVNVLGAPAPVRAGGLVVFAFGTGELKAVFRQGGLPRWDASVLGQRPGRALSTVEDVTGTPVVADDVLYAGSQAGRTVAINAGSGARIWTAREGAISPVLPVGGSVFLISDRNELLRLDASDGSRIWGQRLPNFVDRKPRRASEVFAHHGPVLAGGRLIVASGDGKLRSFSPEDGSFLGEAEIPDGATTRPVVAGGTLYVVGRKGQLHAFR